jgi:hypothetical protein
MGKVIIITTPRATQPDGYAIVTEQDQKDDFKEPVNANKLVIFTTRDVGKVGDVAECNITGTNSCDIISVIKQATWAQGNVTDTSVQVPNGEKVCSQFEVKVLCDPNPFGKKIGDKLLIDNPATDGQTAKLGDNVAALTTTLWELCEVSKII